METSTKINPVMPKRDDGSDKKSLDNLIEELFNETKLPSKPPTNKTLLSPSKVLKKVSSRRLQSKENIQTNKITNWLSKDELKRKINENKPNKVTHKKKKVASLDIVISKPNKKEKTTKSKKSGKSLQRSKSFEKYGVTTPSCQKIEQHRQLLNKQKENLNSLTSIDTDFEIPVLNEFTEPEIVSNEEILDCRNLSLEAIEEYFTNFKEKLDKVINESTFSVKKFDKFNVKYKFSAQNLIVFTDEQKDHMVLLMREKYDPEDRMTSYFFKVLLPELCLWIFMEEHLLNIDEAKDYLENRPIDL